MQAAISAASWVLGKALSPVTDGLLEAWAASAGLGPNVDALKMELLYAQAMLDNTQGREVRSPALKELLLKLRDLAYNADDVLDELEYFRIQDEVEGTHETTNVDDRGCIQGLVLNARHTARAVGNRLKLASCSRDTSRGDPDDQDDAKQGCLSGIRCSCCRRETSSPPASPATHGASAGCMPKVTTAARNTAHAVGKLLPCCSSPSADDDAQAGMLEPDMPDNGPWFLCGGWRSKDQHKNRAMEAPKLKFDRVEISRKMKDIVEQLKPICSKVSTILNLELLSSNRTTPKDIAMDRSKTTPVIIEEKLYGRDKEKNSIVEGITHGEFSANELTVLPIVGPGGIGKTTFTQHIYKEVEAYFQVSIWICVSLNFSATRLAQEAVDKIPKVDGEKETSSNQEVIKQRLKGKRFLLVLDDMWACHEEEWNKLLAPLRNNGEKGNMIIVTTRIPDVANTVKTVGYWMDLGSLGDEDFELFFEACVFGGQKSFKEHEDLREVGKQIVTKLKGFPLAAKTVGRLLRKQLNLEHWKGVLESKEWELQTSDNDIMPALKLSYDYLPFHLQHCFSYCALFPEDREFISEDLIDLWIGLDILHPWEQKKRIEDVGLSYLSDLVNHGFFKKNEDEDGNPYYVVHDLLHELAVKVSSYECLSINSTNVRSIQILPSVQHLSIIIDEKDVNDRMAFEYYKKDLRALDKRLNVESLRTLMLFGEHHGSFAKTFGDMFSEARALRTIFLSGKSYAIEDVLYNFSKLIHLRHLKIKSAAEEDQDSCLADALSRLYHLLVIDLLEYDNMIIGSTKNISNLVKLRHFSVNAEAFHSDIYEVGKLKFLQELVRFEVENESKGFELSQLEQLTELGGKLGIYNLERVRTKEEAQRSKIDHKSHLRKLILKWDYGEDNLILAEGIIESLKPHSNLQDLSIEGHTGTNCPSWLGANLSIKSLESLRLDRVSWNNFPPLGELWLGAQWSEEEYMSCITNQRFHNLKRLELACINNLKRWVINEPCHLFPYLEELSIESCTGLLELRFAHLTCCEQAQDTSTKWFPSLRQLTITRCHKLRSLPNVPWTCGPCNAYISDVGSWDSLSIEYYNLGFFLEISGKNDAPDSTFWDMLAFHNLTKLKRLEMNKCPPIPFDLLRMLPSLERLIVRDLSLLFSLVEGESLAGHHRLPIKGILINNCGVSGKELTQLVSHCSELSDLTIINCHYITGLGVMDQQQEQTVATPASLPSYSVDKAGTAHTGQQQQEAAEEEITAVSAEEGLLLLPRQLQQIAIYSAELVLQPGSLGNDKEAGGGWLQGMGFLRSLEVYGCPKLLSSYSGSPPCFLFPSSLEKLVIFYSEAVETPRLLLLSNLVGLTELRIKNGGGLRCEDFWTLVAHGQLTKLTVEGTPNFFVGLEPSQPHQQEHPSRSSKVREMETDVRTGFFAAPICRLLSSSLTDLDIVDWDEEVERFTKEQEEALLLLTSLQQLRFMDCQKLQCLPQGLHALPSLKRLDIHRCRDLISLPDVLPSSLEELNIITCLALQSLRLFQSALERLYIDDCRAIRSLPKEGLPTSLQELKISSCPAIRSLPKEGLPTSLQELEISYCPAIRSLPKDGLPSSLRLLDVQYGNSEELRRQCRKLKGTIPIVRA
ncbi:hypothetical protein EJB05_39677, partial [Eragrostis curvula]